MYSYIARFSRERRVKLIIMCIAALFAVITLAIAKMTM